MTLRELLKAHSIPVERVLDANIGHPKDGVNVNVAIRADGPGLGFIEIDAQIQARG